MQKQPPSRYVLQETDRVAFPPLCHYSLHPLAERRGMREPSSSHLGAMWNGALRARLGPSSPGAGSLLGQGLSQAVYPLRNICNPQRVEALKAQCHLQVWLQGR
jgi:hypothetical protein